MNKNMKIKLLMFSLAFFVMMIPTIAFAESYEAGKKLDGSTNALYCINGKVYEIKNGTGIDIDDYRQRVINNDWYYSFGYTREFMSEFYHYQDSKNDFWYRLTTGSCYAGIVEGKNKPTLESCLFYSDSTTSSTCTVDNDSQVFDESSETISFTMSCGGELQKKINNLYFKVEYNGNTSAGNSGASSVGKYEVIDQNGTKKIRFYGIKPFKSTEYTNSNMQKYNIEMYLTGVTKQDYGNNQVALDNCVDGNGKLYIGFVQTNIYDETAISISSDKIRNSSICQEIRNYAYDGMSSEDKVVLDFIRQTRFPICYQEKYKMNYSERNTMESTLRKQFDDFKNSYVRIKIDDSNTLKKKDNLTCTDPKMGLNLDKNTGSEPYDVKITARYVGRHWGAICYEAYYLESDVPQLVGSGEGVHYQNKVQINRNCELFPVNVVTMRPACNESVSCGSNHPITPNVFQEFAGPTSDFDSCVNSCDGGKYTQSCINKCYVENYDNDSSKKLSMVLEKENTFNSNIDRMSYKQSPDGSWHWTVNSSEITADDANHSSRSTDTGFVEFFTIGSVFNNTLTSHYDSSYTYSTESAQLYFEDDNRVYDGILVKVKKNGNSVCDVKSLMSCVDEKHLIRVETSIYPVGCSYDPEGEYNAEIADSKNEYRTLVERLRDYKNATPINEYTISMTDTVTGKIYKIKGSSRQYLIDKMDNKGIRLDINLDEGKSSIKLGPETEVHIGDYTNENLVTSVASTYVYNIDLPKQYTLLSEPGTILIEDADSTNTSKRYYKKVAKDGYAEYQFEKVTNVKKAQLGNGERKYYVAINMPAANVEVSCAKIDEKTYYFKDGISKDNELLKDVLNRYNINNKIDEEYFGGTKTTYQSDITVEELEKIKSENPELYSYYQANATYSLNGNIVSANLVRSFDNINVEFQIGTISDTDVFNLNDANGTGYSQSLDTSGKFVKVQNSDGTYSSGDYVCYYGAWAYYDPPVVEKICAKTTLVNTNETDTMCRHDAGSDLYFDSNGNQIDKDTYVRLCYKPCVEFEGNYYDDSKTRVSRETFIERCEHPICEVIGNVWYDDRGLKVTEKVWKERCAGGLRYYYHEIDLNDVFRERQPRWNWTGTINANGLVTGAANNSDLSYIVDPERLIASIESKGNAIYNGTSEDDYVYTITNATIKEIRKYNKQKINGEKRSYTQFDLDNDESTSRYNYSNAVKTWFNSLNTTSITQCNNSTGTSGCNNYGLGGK